MGILGKDYLDYTRPKTHVKVQFGAAGYWVEDSPTMISYGATLTELLNLKSMPKPGSILHFYLSSGQRSAPIRERYTWFLEQLFRDTVSEKKKGQRKKPLAERIYAQCLDPFVSGVSLGADPETDPPQIDIQYELKETADGTHELVEKMYFDRLTDFIYVEFMKGIQKGFVPKRCANCGQWFLQEPGMTYAYCDQVAPGESTLTCRDIGSRASFREKVKNNGVWEVHQRAYKKYFARVRAKSMTKTEFEAWAREAELLRDESLAKYKETQDAEERKRIAAELGTKLNRL